MMPTVGTRVLEYSPVLDTWLHAKVLEEMARLTEQICRRAVCLPGAESRCVINPGLTVSEYLGIKGIVGLRFRTQCTRLQPSSSAPSIEFEDFPMNYSRWEPNPPDDRPNPSVPDPDKRDPIPGYPDPTMPPPEPQRDPSPDPKAGRLARQSPEDYRCALRRTTYRALAPVSEVRVYGEVKAVL
jgi:hypothetical protein